MTMKVNPGVYPSRGAIDFVYQLFDKFNHEHLRFFFIMFISPKSICVFVVKHVGVSGEPCKCVTLDLRDVCVTVIHYAI